MSSTNILLLTFLFFKFTCGNYTFHVDQKFIDLNSVRLHLHRQNVYPVKELAYYGNCLGVAPGISEAIVLNCPGEDNIKKVGSCFQILATKFNPKDNTTSFREQKRKACISKANDACAILATADKKTKLLNCDSFIHAQVSNGIPYNAPPIFEV